MTLPQGNLLYPDRGTSPRGESINQTNASEQIAQDSLTLIH
jgi:hypothetical protein